jgi:hypothetical protein
MVYHSIFPGIVIYLTGKAQIRKFLFLRYLYQKGVFHNAET